MNIFNVGSNGINLYLIDSGTHRILIDSGFPGKLNDLGRAMRSSGFRVQDIDFLFVTHFHVDHAGAVQELKNNGIEFILFDIQLNSLAEMERMTLSKWSYVALERNDRMLSIAQSHAFLHEFGIKGQFVHTPGHSDDSISLLLDSGDTFTGDLRAEFLLDDASSLESQSWQKLRKLGARRVYPSHGPMYELT
jgi:glyoxylase-like metal-dependent hydrolase (beta-lactamase superfamily II)